jgi:hypothetical protein
MLKRLHTVMIGLCLLGGMLGTGCGSDAADNSTTGDAATANDAGGSPTDDKDATASSETDAAVADTDGSVAMASPSSEVEPGSADDGPCGLGLAAPKNGFQVCTTGADVQAQEDTEFCESVTVPGTPDQVYYVGRLEALMTPHSHHLIVMQADVGSAAETNMPDGKRVSCIGGEQAFGAGLSHLMGSQTPYSSQEFPAGVGKIIHGGQRLSFDYHYFNTTDDVVPARAALNFFLIEDGKLEHEAHQFGFYNFLINTPAGKTASFKKSCTFSSDILLYSITRHTHRWGTDFKVWWKGGPHDGEPLWTSTSWELDTDYLFKDGPIKMESGTGFEFECSYDNTTEHALRFGTSATDEMCILFGEWWNIDEMTPAPYQGCRF